MGILLSTKGGRYLKADAERMAGELQEFELDGWKYTVAPSPDNCGLFCIEAHEADGSFIGRFGQ